MSWKQDMQVFATRLRQRRLEVGMSQKDLAEKLGFANSTAANTIGAWENARAYPRPMHLINICRLLSCSADWLLGVKNDQ